MRDGQWRTLLHAQAREAYRKLDEAYQMLERRGARLIYCLEREAKAARECQDLEGESKARAALTEVARDLAQRREGFQERSREYEEMLHPGVVLRLVE